MRNLDNFYSNFLLKINPEQKKHFIQNYKYHEELPDKKVILVVGDGSLGFHVPEIDTSIRHNLPITVVVGNNSLWGIDYWIQKGLYDRDVWTKLDQTNYELVAKGFGAEGKVVDNPSMLLGFCIPIFLTVSG